MHAGLEADSRQPDDILVPPLLEQDHHIACNRGTLYLHRLLSKFNRLQLASVARYLWDNVGLVFYATDLVANYSIPMPPRAATWDRR